MSRFARFSWGVLVYNLGVILWGAYVRASGSGAGCGSHWPLCNGQVIPRAPAVETLVEFTHRLTSGAALLLVVALALWARRAYPAGAPVRRWAHFSLFFMLSEALVGAGLVLFEWVASDASLGRVISIAVHLVNTFLLLAALALTAWFASGNPAPPGLRGLDRTRLLGLGLAYLGVLLLGITGAITALGDTLFPAGTLAEGLRQDLSPTAHFLVRLRFWHPLTAILVGFYLALVAALSSAFSQERQVKRLALALGGLFFLQLLAGLLNLALLVPVWLQLLHLLLADSLWIALVLLGATVLAEPQALRENRAADRQPLVSGG